jgi:hypothetical protein
MKKIKATEDANGRALWLAVSEERSNGYFHLYGRLVVQKLHGDVDGPDDDYSDGLLWSGLRASCQGDDRSRSQNEPVYGFDLYYPQPYNVDLRRGRRMYRTLEKAAKGLEKLREARGYVRSYGEYIGRLAEVFGCTGIVIERDARHRAITGSRWNWQPIGDGVNRVNERIAAWVDDARPAAIERRQLPAAIAAAEVPVVDGELETEAGS